MGLIMAPRGRPPKQKPKLSEKLGKKRQYLTDNFGDLPDDVKALKNGHVYLLYITHSKSPAQTIKALVDRYRCVKSRIKLRKLLTAMTKFSDATSKTVMTRFQELCCRPFHLSEKEPQPSPGYPSGISRDRWHKRRKTGGKRKPIRHKRKFELGRPAANTRIGPKRVHLVRCMGGNTKYRALRLDQGNFAWGSENTTRKTRIIDVVYNASNNELVRTKTLVKNCIIQIDSTPFRQWYESHYALPLARKKGSKLTEAEEEVLNRKRSKKAQKKYEERRKVAKVSQQLEEQFLTGRLLACLSSRPGQCGRADGYILEGKELEFYLRKIKSRKGK